MKKEPFEARCAGNTDPHKLAGALLHAISGGRPVSVLTIGGNAIQQAVKAVIIASGALIQQGKEMVVRPSFTTTTVDTHDEDVDMTAIRFRLEIRECGE
jgi:stage V sporulation protein S